MFNFFNVKELEEAEEEEGSFESVDGTDAAEKSERAKSLPIIQEPNSRKKSIIEEHWHKYGSFELTSVVQTTYEKYFYGTEHWNYFTNDDDLGPVILSLKQENINTRPRDFTTGSDEYTCNSKSLFESPQKSGKK